MKPFYKIIWVLMLLAVSCAAQCVPSQQAFDAAYWASQAPSVTVLQSQGYPGNVITATNLAGQGYTIDVPIMVYHWDACLVQSERKKDGYTWVPSALQPPVTVVPGLTFNGQAYDPANPPSGSIRVTVNAADYKPYVVPAPSQPLPQSTVPVGGLNYANVYFATVGDTRPDGATYTDSRGTFTKHVQANPFGQTIYWTLAAGGSQ